MSVTTEKQDNNAFTSYQSQKIKDDKYDEHRNSKSKESIFVLCETCYWCATYFNKSAVPTHECPHCFAKGLSSFPILPEEAFTFNYNEIRGTEMSFKKRRIVPATN